MASSKHTYQACSPPFRRLRLDVLKRVLSQAQKPDYLQTLMHHLISFTSQQDIPLQGENIILLKYTIRLKSCSILDQITVQSVCEKSSNSHVRISLYLPCERAAPERLLGRREVDSLQGVEW
jgi:hypothetical protein